MNTYVYVNGQLAGSHHYGYTGFVVKVNDLFIKEIMKLCSGSKRRNEQ